MEPRRPIDSSVVQRQLNTVLEWGFRRAEWFSGARLVRECRAGDLEECFTALRADAVTFKPPKWLVDGLVRWHALYKRTTYKSHEGYDQLEARVQVVVEEFQDYLDLFPLPESQPVKPTDFGCQGVIDGCEVSLSKRKKSRDPWRLTVERRGLFIASGQDPRREEAIQIATRLIEAARRKNFNPF